jgi:hypothetical protein
MPPWRAASAVDGRPAGVRRVVDIYYLATPFFALLDLGGGVNLRLAGLGEHPGARIAYYTLCLACLVLMRRAPRLAPAVALLEGSATILILILGVLTPIFRASQLAGSGAGDFSAGVQLEAVINLVLSGGVWVVALYRNPLLLGSRGA